MTEPVTAADVMRDGLQRWISGGTALSTNLVGVLTDALREACGGGDIVIRTDGTLAMLKRDGTVKSSGHWVPLIAVVPVASLERGA